MLKIEFAVNGGARPASELAEITRRALDAQLGFALQDQLGGADPNAEEAARVFGDYFALAARGGGIAEIDDVARARLIEDGRSAGHLHKLDLLIRHNRGSHALSDRHLELQLENMGVAFRAAQADSDRRLILTAWADAQHRAARFNTVEVQAQPQPIQHLLAHSTIRSAPAAGAAAALVGQPTADAPTEASQMAGIAPAAASASPLLSTLIPQIVAGIVSAGNWKSGPGSVAEDAERLLNQFVWMVGDFPANQYTQKHVAEFDREMMAMPKTVRAKRVWHQPFDKVKATFALTAANTRSSMTMNKDLSYLSTFAGRMVAEGYWAEGTINPLKLSHKVTVKQKTKAKSPWTTDHVLLMLSCAIYTGNGGPKRRLKSGPHIHQDAAYWLLLLALFTAACQNELAGLLLVEVAVSKSGIPYLIIRANRLRTLKRDARERVIPIHPRLVELGFLDYVAQLRREGATELFPELWINRVKRGGDQYRAIVWDKLIDWLRRQGSQIPVGIAGKAADFHSLRSTVLSLLDRADINQNIVKDIAGHARVGVTAGTYQDLGGSGGLDEALRERLLVLKRLPDFAADLVPCAVKLLPLNQRSR